MKKSIKWGIIIFVLSGAIFIAFSYFLSTKKKNCLEGEGHRAIEACSFLIGAHTAGFRGVYLVRRAKLLGIENDWDRAASDLNDVIALKYSTQSPPAWVVYAYESLGKINSGKGNSAEARKYFELAAQNGSKEPEVYISLAKVYVEEKKFQEALNLLETAGGFDLAKTHPYYNAQASAYEGLNDFAKAYASLRAALLISAPRPVLADTAKHLGLVCFELKLYKEAETYLDYTLRAGVECLECNLLLTAIRESLDPGPRPAKRSRRLKK